MKTIKMLNGETKYFEETENGFIEVKKPKNKRWLPRVGATYNFVGYSNDIRSKIFNNDSYDNTLVRENNCFKTREEAELKRKIMNFIYERVYNFSMEEWKDLDVNKYYIFADIDSKGMHIAINELYAETGFYFKDDQTAQEVMCFVGFKDWCKYVLGIY